MDHEEAKINENQSSSSGYSNPCPICLGPFIQESYLDTCFRKFLDFLSVLLTRLRLCVLADASSLI